MVSDNIRSVDSAISAVHLTILISFSVSMFVFGVVSIEVWETQLPVWGFVLALCIGVFISSTFSLSTNIPLFSIRIHYTNRRDPGQNEPGSWAKRHYRDDRWIRSPWPPHCYDAIQNVGLYPFGAGTSIYE